jgi:DNA polymerase III subunit delta'
MAFQDIRGNARIKKILRRALVRRRVPSSLLFRGPEGVGKRRMAFELAKAVNCLTLPDDACGVCASCRAIADGTLPDVLEISAVKSEITVEQTVEARELAYRKPMSARKRVFIIDHADEMNRHAANALLKVLEEPPLYCHFFLITAAPDMLPDTVLSRCQSLAFLPVASDEVEEALRAREMSGEQARLIALLVRGNLERALAFDWEDAQARRREAWDLFKAIVTGSGATAFLRLFAYQRKADIKDHFSDTLELFAAFARDLLLLRDGGDPGLLFNPDYEAELRSFEAALSPERAVRMIGAVETARTGLDKNLNMGLLATSLYSQLTG